MAYGYEAAAEAGIDTETEELVIRMSSEVTGVTERREALTDIVDADYLRIDDENVIHVEKDGNYGYVQLTEEQLWKK